MQIQVKQKTSVAEIRGNTGRSKAAEFASCGREQDVSGASQAGHHSANQSRRERINRYRTGLPLNPVIVPVFAPDGEVLMPTCASRARRWVKQGKATPFWLNGVWCVRLCFEPNGRKKQEVVVGIDPGSKREAFTVASKAHTYINILADAVTWVKDAVETRRNLRRSRRNRKTPCRANRKNRSKSPFPPSTKARWQLKLRVVNQLRKMFPITGYVVEDIKATTHGKSEGWNKSFSPLETGKRWLYSELEKLGSLSLKAGHETALLREQYQLLKTTDKMALTFSAHNVDSWVLAKSELEFRGRPENTRITHCRPLQFRRRSLHLQNPTRGGTRRSHGGTLSLGFKRGSLAKHPKYGLCTIGGTLKGRLSLHGMDGKRLCQNAKLQDVKLLRRTSLLFLPVNPADFLCQLKQAVSVRPSL
jgi:hypothetical protein